MSTDRTDKIRTRAYEIWEEQGRPHGKHDEHWHKAAQEHGEGASEGGSAGAISHPGMMGDGTEEQNLGEPGDPSARIKEADVKEAFRAGAADKTPGKTGR